MKNLYFFLATIAVSICLFASCESREWDFAPLEISIYVNDSEGSNLLDETIQGNILNNKIEAKFLGENYPLWNPENTLYTKAYLPEFRGLSIQKDRYGNQYISFGELAGDDFFDNDVLVINWGDGTSDEISIYSKIRWVFGEPKFKRVFRINGKDNNGTTIFTIVK